MSLFDAYRHSQQSTKINNQSFHPMQELKSNPLATVRRAGFTVPDGMTNPQQIVNYLLHSGQVNNPRLMQAQQMMQRMMRK